MPVSREEKETLKRSASAVRIVDDEFLYSVFNTACRHSWYAFLDASQQA